MASAKGVPVVQTTRPPVMDGTGELSEKGQNQEGGWDSFKKKSIEDSGTWPAVLIDEATDDGAHQYNQHHMSIQARVAGGQWRKSVKMEDAHDLWLIHGRALTVKMSIDSCSSGNLPHLSMCK